MKAGAVDLVEPFEDQDLLDSIQRELGAAEKTIKVHRGRIMAKTQANSLVDLARMTERIGIKHPRR